MMRKFFLRRLWKYTLALLIPTLILISIFLGFLTRSTLKEIREESARAAARCQENIGVLISEAVYQHDLLTLDPRIPQALRRLLTHDTISYIDHISLNTLTGSMDSILTAHPYIRSTYLQMDGYEHFYSSQDRTQLITEYFDQSWYTSIRSIEDPSRRFVQRRLVRRTNYEQPLDYVTVYRKMSTARGTIVVNFDALSIKKRLDSLVANPFESFCLINSAGSSVLVSSNFEDLSNTEDVSTALSTYDNNAPRWVSLMDDYYYITKVYDSTYGLTYVSLISSEYFLDTITPVLLWVLLVVIIEFIIIFCVSYLVAKESFTHIQRIIDLFSDAEKGIYPSDTPQKIQDEYDLVLFNVVRMFINTTFLNTRLQEQKFEKEAAELAALQLQISPHFLFNTLQIIDFEAARISGGKSEMNRLIGNLSDILKYSLESPSMFVPFITELDILRKYISIQKFRFGNAIAFYTDVDDNTAEVCVPRLILQPLLENSISHGILPAGGEGYIMLEARIEDSLLHISVTDNGVGMAPERLDEVNEMIHNQGSKNIGLTNVHRRLVLDFGESSGLNIQSDEINGTEISFTIPITSATSPEH